MHGPWPVILCHPIGNAIMKRLVAIWPLVLCSLSAAALAAEDWPRWRGPDGNGITEAPGFDPTLNGGNPEVLWSAEVGNGYGQVAVAGGRAYVAGHERGRETLHCFDAASGERLWSDSYKAKKFDNMNAGGPAATPAVGQGKVFHVSRDGKALAEDLLEPEISRADEVKRPVMGHAGRHPRNVRVIPKSRDFH